MGRVNFLQCELGLGFSILLRSGLGLFDFFLGQPIFALGPIFLLKTAVFELNRGFSSVFNSFGLKLKSVFLEPVC